MSFSRRLKAYIIGIGLGIIMVMVIFRNKAKLFTSWLPEKRIIAELVEKPFLANSHAKCQLSCTSMSEEAIHRKLQDETKVDFSSSKGSESPRKYCLLQKWSGEETIVMVEIADSLATITEIINKKSRSCNCR